MSLVSQRYKQMDKFIIVLQLKIAKKENNLNFASLSFL